MWFTLDREPELHVGAALSSVALFTLGRFSGCNDNIGSLSIGLCVHLLGLVPHEVPNDGVFGNVGAGAVPGL